MKKTILLFLTLGCVFFAKAQDEEGYSDEDLTKYASVMVWAETEQGNMSTVLVERIKSDTALTGSYNDMKQAYGDEAKLEEIGATDEQIAAYEAIVTFEDSIKESFKEVYVGKIKEDIGVSLYNGLKKDLKSDEEVKARYEVIYTSLKEESEGDETEEDSEE